ncbi:ABC-type transport auxiliary lipoprotein family protein [Rhodoferax sp.]|uniref:ABC-type transport auxiliary lipoprotein family protein n=1 Tax=Rhodoferax sp. TaxID=50421 RepID=UPI00272F9A41|nr:ABC-type transport auxiliary lipoprotein family protein [Rhodoferax sp.]MDP2441358.1 ABC-type transport auxiliary lipoprotein family protein [Rhodoferax sp.]MDP3191724.1 ABC-type transport auxiliary lipoprotein family protein [Rhodoferax sp.]MDP3338068.1 ABC-type transport auxiliary lipoprotein family protein [Rhodoferax sp.]MDZ4207220.1 ABC-type transport auxiliary lipoprotein family protein [Rhodoferax sp.]
MSGLPREESLNDGLAFCGVDFSRPGRLKPAPQDSKSGGRSLLRLAVIGVSLAALSACSALAPASAPATIFYALNNPVPEHARTVTGPTPGASTAPTLLINPPHAAAGFDSPRIIYLREAHKLDYFALSQWVEPPARMLGPLLVTAIEKTGAFRAVVLMPGAASGELRLDTDLVRLQHDFQTRPSQVRLTLRATLVDDQTRRVLAWHEFEAAEPADSEDAYGGVLAANRAVQKVADQLARFLAATASVPSAGPSTP